MILKVYYYVIVKRLTRGASSVKVLDIFLYLLMFLIVIDQRFFCWSLFLCRRFWGNETTETIYATWQACTD